MDSSGSNNEDFRSVIDDLTVENKRLRQKLRKYDEVNCSHLQGDKLFEIRIHGLPMHKKRELEETLRVFASSLDAYPSRPKSYSAPQSPTLPPITLPSRMNSSSVTSFSRPADSAYASMFASGDTSAAKSQVKQRSMRSTKLTEQNIKSYLLDIPEGLFPNHSPVMTEKARMEVVVKRLEQLFTGKEPASEMYSQPRQQQEVSQSAAKADRNTVEARGHRVDVEGVRESRILPADAESLADARSDEQVPAKLRSTNRTRCSSAQSRDGDTKVSNDSSPVQRPTRPLDLDPNRAQVPTENIEYIRHLGVSPPRRDVNPSTENREGWVYLNLLTSMAQLHTINVTPNFVRRAVTEVSDRFELSRDGRKIRWRGGTEGTRMSSDFGSGSEQLSGKSPDDGPGPSSKRRKLNDERSGYGLPRPDFELGSSSDKVLNDKFDYKPLFLHTACPQEEDDYCFHASDSLTSLGPAGDDRSILPDSSAPSRPGMSSNFPEQKRGNGPIIFYHGAIFYTDLSGDRSGVSYDDVEFAHQKHDIIGCAPSTSKDILVHAEDVREFLAEYPMSPDRMEYEDDDTGFTTANFNFQTMRSIDSDRVSDGAAPLELEASGIGGVEPLDNFAINVQVRHVVSSPGHCNRKVLRSLRQHSFSAVCTGMLGNKLTETIVRSEVVSATKINLPPSLLPPPSYFFLDFSSSDGDDDNDTDSDSNDSGNDASCSSATDIE